MRVQKRRKKTPQLWAKLFFSLQKNRRTILITLILCFGFLVRLYPAMTRVFWEDELATYAYATSPYPTVRQLIHPMDDRPPLFYLSVRLFTTFIYRDVYLRLPIVVLSLVSCFIMYRAVSLLNKRAGWIILFLMCFSLYRVEYSWQLRDYGFMSVFTSGAFYCLVVYLRTLLKNHRIQWNALYGMTTICFLGAMTNYVFLIFVICLLICVIVITSIWSYTRTKKIPWSFMGKLALLQLPLVISATYYLSYQLPYIKLANSWIPKASLYSYLLIQAVFLGFSNVFYDLYSTDTYYTYYSVATGVFIAALFGYFIYTLEKNKRAISSIIRIVFYSGIGMYVLGVIGVLITSTIIDTNLILIRTFLRIGTMLLVSYGLGLYIVVETIVKKTYVKRTIVLIGIIGIGLFSRLYIEWYRPTIVEFLNRVPRHYGLAKFDELYKPGDQVVFLPSYYNIIYPVYFWKYTPERFSSLEVYMDVYTPEAQYLSEPFKLLRATYPQLISTYKNKPTGRVILLNWQDKNNEYWRLDEYCKDKKHSVFQNMYTQGDMSISVCDEAYTP